MQVAAGICQGNLKLWHCNWTCTSRCLAYKHTKNHVFFFLKKEKKEKKLGFLCTTTFSFSFFFFLQSFARHAAVVSCQEQKEPSARSGQALLQEAVPAGSRQQPACAACDVGGQEVPWTPGAAPDPLSPSLTQLCWCSSVLGQDGSLASHCPNTPVLASRYSSITIETTLSSSVGLEIGLDWKTSLLTTI